MKQKSRLALIIVTAPLIVEVLRAYLTAAASAADGLGWRVTWWFDKYFPGEPWVDGVFYLAIVPAIWILNVVYWRDK